MNQPDQTRTPRFDVRGDEFSKDEEDALDRRRERSETKVDQPLMGLALSGGGVRSATFCIGLLRALAKNKVLHQFDYLSTVSGGGYAGAAFGRLFSTKATPEKVEIGLADDGSLLLWWLRRNGRYLLPAGMRDVLQTWAGQLRGFIATQFEVAMIFALVSCLIVAPHLLGYNADLHLLGYGADKSPVPLFMQTAWWLLVPFAAWAAVFMGFAYWWSGDPEDRSVRNEFIIGAVTLFLAVYLLSPLWTANRPAHPNGTMTVIGAILLAAPLSRLWLCIHATNAEKDRVLYTRWLALSLKVMLFFLALGASDLVSWFLVDQIATTTRHGTVLTTAGLTALLVALARFVLPLLHARTGKSSMMQVPLTVVANVCGLILVVLLALSWLCTVQYFVFLARLSSIDARMHWLTQLAPVLASRPFSHSLMRLFIVAAPCGLYVLLTGRNLQLINRSSLHAFYRSRIARTYVSLGNSPDARHRRQQPAMSTGMRKTWQAMIAKVSLLDDIGPEPTKSEKPKTPPERHRFDYSPLCHKIPGQDNAVVKLTEVLVGDDIPIPKYSPHKFGGPIHLINCCINQTIDDRTDTYNADRKGVYLTVSSLGVEIGTQLKQTNENDHPLIKSTLAEWIAVSGAAAGSGMGSMTRTGISALFFLSGLRLGYWWSNGLNAEKFWWRCLGKSRAALQEMLARFPGVQNPVWYLSDGGHFDNTGVYSLLKRKLKLIVLADCGADPHYVFADLENLIRKARIDMDTTIEFIDPVSLPRDIGKALRKHFGTPDGITSVPGDQYLLLGRISYPGGESGCLLVVKPRLCDSLPLDVAGYADNHVDFPQQSTAKQFFDEAQWESYCQLGAVLGQVVNADLLEKLPTLAVDGRPIRANSMLGKITSDAKTDEKAAAEKSSAQTRRQRIGATLGASFSIGVLATVGIGGWEAWNAFATQQRTDEIADRQQSSTDMLQTDLEAGAAYDSKIHARLYRQLQQYDDGQDSDDVTRAMRQLAGALNRSCARLDRSSALFDRCLADDMALLRAAPKSSIWNNALRDYANGTPKFAASSPVPAGALAATMTAMQKACNAGTLAKPQHISLYAMDLPPANASTLRGQFDAFGLVRQTIGSDFGSADNIFIAAPVGWSKPVILYSTDSAQAQVCASSLARWLASQKEFTNLAPRALPVPIPLFGNANAIELWMPQPSKDPLM